MGVRGRSIIGLLGVSLCLAGCLFPSFDGMDKGGDDSSKSGDNKGDPKNGSSTKPGGETTDQQSSAQTSNDGASSSSSGGSPAQGGAAGVPAHPSTGKIACGKTTCDSKTQYCCPAWGDAECEPANKQGFCQAVVRCDGPEDCGAGEQCCAGFNEGKCSKDCGGARILCHPNASSPTSTCPNNRKCTGVHTFNEVVSASFCE